MRELTRGSTHTLSYLVYCIEPRGRNSSLYGQSDRNVYSSESVQGRRWRGGR